MKPVCPYSGYDDSGCEVCELTGKPIETADELVRCDFEYDECELFVRKQNENIRGGAATAQR